MAGKYHPLKEHLQSLSKSRKSLTLSFAELETILGARLPKSASTYIEWWSNQEYGPQAASWRGAGFRVETIHPDREVVTFARDKKTSRGRKRKKVEKFKRQAKLVAEDILLNAGFAHVGDWVLAGDTIRLASELSRDAAVYAHVVDGKVMYIGVTKRGLKTRMGHYAKPGASQTTSIRIKGLLQKELQAGRSVYVLAAFPEPGSWNGLPVDNVAGLESGLIKTYGPPWNKQGK